MFHPDVLIIFSIKVEKLKSWYEMNFNSISFHNFFKICLAEKFSMK